MFPKKTSIRFFVLTFFSVYFFGCIQTNTITTDYQRLGDLKNPAFIGTFCSISVLKNESDSSYYDLATAYFNYRYDSIIKARVTNMRPVNMLEKLDKPAIQSLSRELIEVINRSKNYNGLNDQPRRTTMDSIADLFPERYSSYFVSYGNVLAPNDFKNYKLGKAVVNGLVIGAMVLVSLTMQAIFNSNSSTNLNVNNGDEKFQDGVFCYLIIYDRGKKEVCFVRKQYFRSDSKNNQPFHPTKVNKQISVIFKEYLRR